MGQTLSDRARELALDVEVERDALERRRQEVIAEREAEVAKVRERYRVRLDEIEHDLSLAKRLKKALDPEGAKRETAAKRPATTAYGMTERAKRWRPSPEVFDALLVAVRDGAETVRTISEHPAFTWSRATAGQAIPWAREDGWIRLAGSTGGRGGAPRFRITPQGEEHLRATTNGSELVSQT